MNKTLITISWTASAIAGGLGLVVHIREANRRRKLDKLMQEVRQTMATVEWQKQSFQDRMDYLFDAHHRAGQI